MKDQQKILDFLFNLQIDKLERLSLKLHTIPKKSDKIRYLEKIIAKSLKKLRKKMG